MLTFTIRMMIQICILTIWIHHPRYDVPAIYVSADNISLQELFNKFQSLVLPEAVNFLFSEDEGILDMINEVANFTLTNYPGENIRTALKSLANGLRERSLKVRSLSIPLNEYRVLWCVSLYYWYRQKRNRHYNLAYLLQRVDYNQFC